jgi:DNA-binding winged helix-turn-helix (wHTH) protein
MQPTRECHVRSFPGVAAPRRAVGHGQPIKLGGRSFDLLTALIEAHGAVVSKDALMARVWPGRTVEENALQAQISALRTALGAERELIRTVSGRGYQFTGEIRLPLALGNRLHDASAKGATRSGRVGRNSCPQKRGNLTARARHA